MAVSFYHASGQCAPRYTAFATELTAHIRGTGTGTGTGTGNVDAALAQIKSCIDGRTLARRGFVYTTLDNNHTEDIIINRRLYRLIEHIRGIIEADPTQCTVRFTGNGTNLIFTVSGTSGGVPYSYNTGTVRKANRFNDLIELLIDFSATENRRDDWNFDGEFTPPAAGTIAADVLACLDDIRAGRNPCDRLVFCNECRGWGHTEAVCPAPEIKYRHCFRCDGYFHSIGACPTPKLYEFLPIVTVDNNRIVGRLCQEQDPPCILNHCTSCDGFGHADGACTTYLNYAYNGFCKICRGVSHSERNGCPTPENTPVYLVEACMREHRRCRLHRCNVCFGFGHRNNACARLLSSRFTSQCKSCKGFFHDSEACPTPVGDRVNARVCFSSLSREHQLQRPTGGGTRRHRKTLRRRHTRKH